MSQGSPPFVQRELTPDLEEDTIKLVKINFLYLY